MILLDKELLNESIEKEEKAVNAESSGGNCSCHVHVLVLFPEDVVACSPCGIVKGQITLCASLVPCIPPKLP